ncbi:MAG: DNA helicase RecQ [Clostridia bacterium]|nr:DNA helicase RecQ [Clostridia bacterium]
MEPKTVLKKYFGYDTFRHGQETIIEHILNGEDTLGIMPTGAGKSICYQIPAVIFEGVTIVISPLISLMKDQVDSLNEVGIPATYVNSTLSYRDYEQTIENIVHNVYKIIYVAPERLESETFLNVLNNIDISMFTIDEAHCVSQWGHDFRPSYCYIAEVIKKLKKRPIVSSFTATATKRVKEDIIHLLELQNPFSLTTSFDRKNLTFKVETPEKKFDFIKEYLKGDFATASSGIIYCVTRKNVDSLHQKLSDLGYSVSKYHAGMTEKARTQNQDDFTYDRTQIMVATNAFGMGIDKSNIRFVIHYNMPKDLESYYQEAGRAGRDGLASECILLFSRSDIVDNKFLIDSIPNENHFYEYEKLNDMIDYCNTDKCLRKYILEYFGEETQFDHCDNCSNCLSTVEISDITLESQKILSCIKRMRGNFGSNLVTDVLKGAKVEKIRRYHFDELSTYGIMHEYTKETIKSFIAYLETEDYVKTVGNEYPVLSLTPRADEVLFCGQKVLVKRKFEKIPEKKIGFHMDDTDGANTTQKPLNVDKTLFEQLRKLRMELAIQNNVPPFIIFADTTLKEMSAYYPVSKESMLAIKGVGEAKFEKYGETFIQAISEYLTQNNIIPS